MKNSFSIIIPARDEESYIGKCLKSIKKIKYSGKLEVIVVNNGSTDRTAKVAENLGAQVFREDRLGVSYARNLGAKKAKYDYLFFLDADCMLTKDYFSNLDKMMEIYGKQDVYAGPYVLYDGGWLIRYITDRLNYYYWYFRLIKLITNAQCFAGGNFVIRRDVFNKTGDFDTSIDNVLKAEDLEYALRLNRLGYKVYFRKDLRVLSSFRRIKRSPIRTMLVRLYYSIKLIYEHKCMQSKSHRNIQSNFRI